MSNNNTFVSHEIINGFCSKSRSLVTYKAILEYNPTAKIPAKMTLTLEFNPFVYPIPETHVIKGENITDIYIKLIRFLKKQELVLKN